MAYWILTISTLIAVYICSTLFSLYRNWRVAKASGIPYVIAPAYFPQVLWVLLSPAILPLLRSLPSTWTRTWLPFIDTPKFWHQGYAPFADLGTDIVLVVTPVKNVLWTCNPEANQQIFSRQADFPKPLELFGPINAFGQTVAGSEGAEWRVQRKITGRPFNHAQYCDVWAYTIQKTIELLATENGPKRNGLISRPRHDVARLTLTVLNRICFGQEVALPSDDAETEALPHGHKLRFSEVSLTVIQSLATLFIWPGFILNISPLQSHQAAWRCFKELSQYIEELRSAAKRRLETEDVRDSLNVLESIVQASNTQKDGSPPLISPDVLLGNIFVFILAGHETTANLLNFSILYLAIFPEVQAKVQADIASILGDRAPDQWSMETDFQPLMDSHVGALMSELNRLYAVLPWLPRCTKTPQVVTFDNGKRSYIVPPDTTIIISTNATHRHPAHWPDRARTELKDANLLLHEQAPYPLSSFDLDRWLSKEIDQHGVERTKLVSPKPGSFVPFSGGPRICLGIRFAQAEYCAAMAAIFKSHSVKLDSSNGDPAASRRAAITALSGGMEFDMNLKLAQEIPVRLVPRSKE